MMCLQFLAIDSTGKIYVGAQNEIGYLVPDSIGSYQYVSLLSEIDSAYHNFDNVWQIHITPEYLYFGTRKYLFRRDHSGNYKIWKAKTTFHTSFFLKEFGFFVGEGWIIIKRGVCCKYTEVPPPRE